MSKVGVTVTSWHNPGVCGLVSVSTTQHTLMGRAEDRGPTDLNIGLSCRSAGVVLCHRLRNSKFLDLNDHRTGIKSVSLDVVMPLFWLQVSLRLIWYVS